MGIMKGMASIGSLIGVREHVRDIQASDEPNIEAQNARIDIRFLGAPGRVSQVLKEMLSIRLKSTMRSATQLEGDQSAG